MNVYVEYVLHPVHEFLVYIVLVKEGNRERVFYFKEKTDPIAHYEWYSFFIGRVDPPLRQETVS